VPTAHGNLKRLLDNKHSLNPTISSMLPDARTTFQRLCNLHKCSLKMLPRNDKKLKRKEKTNEKCSVSVRRNVFATLLHVLTLRLGHLSHMKTKLLTDPRFYIMPYAICSISSAYSNFFLQSLLFAHSPVLEPLSRLPRLTLRPRSDMPPTECLLFGLRATFNCVRARRPPDMGFSKLAGDPSRPRLWPYRFWLSRNKRLCSCEGVLLETLGRRRLELV
jgi:hypothetical protein